MKDAQFIPFLTPLRSEPKLSPVIAFDTETYGETNTFQIGVVSTKERDYLFTDAQELLDFLCRKEFWNHNVYATNLAFDAFACFQSAYSPGKMPPAWSFFDNGSKLIWVKKLVSQETRWDGRQINRYQTLLDSLNIFQAGVEQMGEILNRVGGDYFPESKLIKPRWLGKKKWGNLTTSERNELSTYCAADARVTRKFMEWFALEVTKLGGELKITAASTAMDLFRRKYLREANMAIPQPAWPCMVDSRFSYYGGRTEDFVRGIVKEPWDADVTSMYPSAMLECNYPYPSPEHFVKWTSPPSSCLQHEGFAKVTIVVPFMQIPPLPFKVDGKLLFPFGSLTGVWTHLEIRYAQTLGCKVEEIEWSYFNPKTFNPFKSYVEDLFQKRMTYAYPSICDDSCNCNGRITGKKCKFGMAVEEVIKLFHNGLYGKFAQNFLTKEQGDSFGLVVKKAGGTFKSFEDASIDEIMFTSINFPEYLARGYVINKAIPKLKQFMNPILSSYTTAQARIRLHQFILRAIAEGATVLYTDTDSLYYTTPNGKPLSFVVPNKQMGLLQGGKQYAEILIFNPKTKRLLTKDGKVINTAKGIPKKSFITNFAKLRDDMTQEELDEMTEELEPREDFFQSLKIADENQGAARMSRFLKFKEAMSRDLQPNQIVPMTKHASPDAFPKRRILGNPSFEDLWRGSYQTTPWEVQNQELII